MRHVYMTCIELADMIDRTYLMTHCRFAKARVRVLEKQVEDGKLLRQQLLEQVHDIQKQLQNEREENKKLKKR